MDDEDFGRELAEEGGGEEMTHVFMELQVKEEAKSHWGFKQVPFLVFADADKCVVAAGGPKQVRTPTTRIKNGCRHELKPNPHSPTKPPSMRLLYRLHSLTNQRILLTCVDGFERAIARGQAD